MNGIKYGPYLGTWLNSDSFMHACNLACELSMLVANLIHVIIILCIISQLVWAQQTRKM